MKYDKTLKQSWLETPLGRMIVIADEAAIYLLEFEDCVGLQREIERLEIKTKALTIPGKTEPIQSIESELNLYFQSKLKQFRTPFCLLGTEFQNQVWGELKKIPHGETRSYSDIAVAVGRPASFRAVAQANAANQIAIVIPCHRVINTSGELGGYAGGVVRKQSLLDHEQNHRKHMEFFHDNTESL
jgi:AraC family transcriptional regulator of adaptative response/methylated-DNA-[protein]-cysteine methyltransferase